MNCSRRTFISAVIPAAATFSLAVSAAVATPHFQTTRPTQPFPGTEPQPNPPRFPPISTPADPSANPKPMLMHNQEEIQEDIRKLYLLAEQLKKQVDKTNTADVLSLSLVDNAKKIEDLAKQIKNLAKAA
jgi:hypothetical protein